MKTDKKIRQVEHGQSLVIMVFAMLLLVALAALLIDLGFIFVQRRRMQNAADNSALAGVYYLLHTEKKSEAVLLAEIRHVAEANGVENCPANLDAYYTGLNGVLLPGCNVVGTCGSVPNQTYGIKIAARRRVDGIFIPSFGLEGYHAQAGATAILRPSGEYLSLFPFALLALGTCENSMMIGGCYNEVIGDVHSNNDISIQYNDPQGYGNHVHGTASAENQVVIDDPPWWTFLPRNKVEQVVNHSVYVSNPMLSLTPIDIKNLAMGEGMIVHDLSSPGEVNISRLQNQGLYNQNTRRLSPGIYFAGNNEIKLSSPWTIRGYVTLLTANQISISGDGTHKMDPYYKGMLMFTTFGSQHECGEEAITIEGNVELFNQPSIIHTPNGSVASWTESGHYFRGLIYAPGGQVSLKTRSASYLGAIVGQTINLSNPECSVDLAQTNLIVRGEAGDILPQIELIQ